MARSSATELHDAMNFLATGLASAHAGFLVQFAGGGLIFVLGYVAATRSGALDWSSPVHRRWAAAGIGLAATIFLVQGFLQFIAVHF